LESPSLKLGSTDRSACRKIMAPAASPPSKCILCRAESPSSSSSVPNRSRKRTKSLPKGRHCRVFEKWNEECASVLSRILMKSAGSSEQGTTKLTKVFSGASYCSTCLQRVRDLTLAFDIVRKHRHQMSLLIQAIVHDLSINHSNVPNRTEGNGKRSSRKAGFEYDECVRVIYKGTLCTI
jgi:hypothetical protein